MDSLDYDFGEEAPRHRKKSKKRHVRSDHKHEYEKVCIDSHTRTHTREGVFTSYNIATRCRICGRLHDVKLWATRETPKEMPLYEVADFLELIQMKMLPDKMRVR